MDRGGGSTGGLLPQFNITYTTGETITFTKGGMMITAQEVSSGLYVAEVPSFGTWTISATRSGTTSSFDYLVDTCKLYVLTSIKGNQLVPKLTEASANVLSSPNNYGSYYPYWVYNRENNGNAQSWVVQGNYGNGTAYMGYKFENPVAVLNIYFMNRSESAPRAPKTFKLQYSDDGITWTDNGSDVYTIAANTVGLESSFDVTTVSSHLYWRILILTVYDTSYMGIGRLQFYGF